MNLVNPPSLSSIFSKVWFYVKFEISVGAEGEARTAVSLKRTFEGSYSMKAFAEYSANCETMRKSPISPEFQQTLDVMKATNLRP